MQSRHHEYETAVRDIVRENGNCHRETAILSAPHITEPDPDTWGPDHKVVNVIAATPEEDGYHHGFAVDLVTRSICG